MIGIPATLLLFYVIVEKLMTWTTVCLNMFINFVQPRLNKIESGGKAKIKRNHLHIMFALLCAFCVFVVFFILPTIVYSAIEGWSFMDAFYFVFIR